MAIDEKHTVKVIETRAFARRQRTSSTDPGMRTVCRRHTPLPGGASTSTPGKGEHFGTRSARPPSTGTWKASRAEPSVGTARDHAVESRDGVFFINYLTELRDVAVTLVADLEQGCGLVLRNVLVSPTDQRDFRSEIPPWHEANLRQESYSCRLAGVEPAGPLPHLSAELVGNAHTRSTQTTSSPSTCT